MHVLLSFKYLLFWSWIFLTEIITSQHFCNKHAIPCTSILHFFIKIKLNLVEHHPQDLMRYLLSVTVHGFLSFSHANWWASWYSHRFRRSWEASMWGTSLLCSLSTSVKSSQTWSKFSTFPEPANLILFSSHEEPRSLWYGDWMSGDVFRQIQLNPLSGCT